MLAEAIGQLSPAGNRRVEFAACLYHLELARLGVASSRAEFARRDRADALRQAKAALMPGEKLKGVK
jgi:hypothetical protein